MRKIATCFLAVLALMGCEKSNEKKHPLFTKLPSRHSSVFFQNKIEETEQINILAYEYTYNGGGVTSSNFKSFRFK